MEQKVQGPRPSFTQMILPQDRQLGATARRGWRVARQVQRREAGVAVERDGLVCSSSVRMAESCKCRVNRYSLRYRWKPYKVLQCRRCAMHRGSALNVDLGLGGRGRGAR